MTLMAMEESAGPANLLGEQLKSLVVYSDHAAASKVMTLRQRVLRQFMPDRSMRTAWWALASLKDKVLFDASCQHAAEADLLFLSLTVSDKLPTEIKAWLQAVFTRKPRPHPALVAMLGTKGRLPAEVNHLDSYLHEQSRHAGIDYFIYWHRQKDSAAKGFLANHHHHTATSQAFDKGKIKHEGVSHWGINE